MTPVASIVLFSLLFACVTLAARKPLPSVPMVHQRWDTPDWFDGNWACGPTSSVMALAAFGVLKPHPITCSLPTKHSNSFGWYVADTYTANGMTFNLTAKDPRGKLATGAYGYCWHSGSTDGTIITKFNSLNGLKTNLVNRPTDAGVKAALDKGHLVLLSTMNLVPGAHYILAIGHNSTSGKLICNDPWGNANNHATYGKLMNGAGVEYAFAQTGAASRWMIEFKVLYWMSKKRMRDVAEGVQGTVPKVAPIRVVNPPRYVLDLDLPPSQRWDQIIDDYKGRWGIIETFANEVARETFGPYLGPTLKSAATVASKLFNSFSTSTYSEELRGIAKRSGMDEGLLVLMQLVYEGSTCCTSIVVPDSHSVPHHMTMDWLMSVLEDLTIEVEFRRGGQTLFLATTWAGYVGVLTGMKGGAFSASVNHRSTQGGSYWSNIVEAAKALALSSSPLIAPVYFTVAGSHLNEGLVLTRNRDCDVNRVTLGGGESLVQANADHFLLNEPDFDDETDSIGRVKIARRELKKLSGSNFTVEELWRLMSLKPIMDETTLYGTYMNPKSNIYETRLKTKLSGGFTFLPRKAPKEAATKKKKTKTKE